jgi:hypothetical protein
MALVAVAQAAEAPAGPASAPAPAAAPAAAPEKAASQGGADEAATHHAKGEVKYGDTWTPITELFATYQRLEREVKEAAEKGAGGKDRLTEINKALAMILADWRKAKQPVENEKSAAEAKKHTAERVLASGPPQPPRMLPEPSPSSGRSWTGGTGGVDSYDHWQRDVARVRAENQRRQEQYQRDLARYNEYRQQAAKVLEETRATIDACTQKLADLLAARKTKELPLLDERTKLNAQMRSGTPETASNRNRAEALEQALWAAPESLRLANGIVAWQEEFYCLADLEEMYKKVKAEIDEARKQAEARARLDGKELPKDWRHPKQAEADGLAALVAKAKLAAPAAK